MSDVLSVFGGTGFVGSAFINKYPQHLLMERKDVVPASDTVLYLISTVDNYNVFTDLTLDINTNLTHLMHVLEQCKGRVKKFVFISSWFVYGNVEMPAAETAACKPKGFYSITKYAAELMLESFCRTFNIDYQIIRLANVVGKGDGKVSKRKNALQYLIDEMKNNRPINLYNNGMFYRDFIDVDDVARGIDHIINYGEHNETYNLGRGVPVLFKDMIMYAYSKLSSTSAIGEMQPTDFHKIVQVESMYLDTSKLEALGFKCSKSVHAMIDSLLE